MGRLARETDEGKKIAAVLDNARFHHAKALNDLYAPGQALERITPIYMPPPYAPTLGLTEHIRDAAKANIANPPRSPRRTPSRPSPPTSPTAPSTTTSSTSQSRHHTPILFKSSHI
ncbi:transposase [Actinomyces israelii]|uniref:transposase n=1 Tax=Actinomyces israelii TaxID=1659 RepID=UPI00338EE131